jgi:hypothetical protein
VKATEEVLAREKQVREAKQLGEQAVADAKAEAEEAAEHVRLEHEAECHEAENKLKQAEAETERVKTEFFAEARIEFENRFALEAQLRRTIHEELMTLKGNIRVFCRVRPLLRGEVKAGKVMSCAFPADGNKQVVELKIKDRSGANRKHRFTFNQALDPNTSQVEVFDDVRQLCDSILDGHNVCVFAYGQTGSGKTYTMEGEGEEMGITYRAITCLWEGSKARMFTLGESWEMAVSVYEVYNEQVCDLLVSKGKKDENSASPGWSNDNKLAGNGSSSRRSSLSIRGGEVAGLTARRCVSVEQVKLLLRKGHNARVSATHKLNEHSSRSHLVLSLQMWTGPDAEESGGTLHLVDLAGSERVKKSGVEKQQLLEAQVGHEYATAWYHSASSHHLLLSSLAHQQVSRRLG